MTQRGVWNGPAMQPRKRVPEDLRGRPGRPRVTISEVANGRVQQQLRVTPDAKGQVPVRPGATGTVTARDANGKLLYKKKGLPPGSKVEVPALFGELPSRSSGARPSPTPTIKKPRQRPGGDSIGGGETKRHGGAPKARAPFSGTFKLDTKLGPQILGSRRPLGRTNRAAIERPRKFRL